MSPRHFDSLIDGAAPTFHDSTLLRLDGDYANVRLTALFEVFEGAGFAGYFFSSGADAFIRLAPRTASLEWDQHQDLS